MFFDQALSPLSEIWPYVLRGFILLMIGCGTGWALGRYRSLAPVRMVDWWVRRVVIPLLRGRSWLARASTIFANNMLILTGIVAVGVWDFAAISAVAVMGVSLGIGLAILMSMAQSSFAGGSSRETTDSARGSVARVRFGMWLNLLEPPAIVIAIGLALGRTAAGWNSSQVWSCFAFVVLPAMLLAACGEALWIGEINWDEETRDEDAPPPDN